MKAGSCAFGFCLLFSILGQGQPFDYQWPIGYGGNIAEGFGISLLDFNNQAVTLNLFAEMDDFYLHNGGSFICDGNGQLALVTNNCSVFDQNLQPILNADTLTPGQYYNTFCEQYGEYPSYQNTIFLPEMTNDSVFYLLHKDAEISSVLEDVISRNLYLSTIVRKQDGSYYLKEKVLLLHADMVTQRLTACLDHSGNRWWVWVGGYETNKFYKFQIGGTGLYQGPFTQNIGNQLSTDNLDIGQTAFSPDAKTLGINTNIAMLWLYDFDNETGDLSNFREVPYPAAADEGGQGLAFSPNSRFAYVTTSSNLYQIDLQQSNAVEHIAFHHSFDEDGWPVGMGVVYPGPDCRIYIAPGTTTYYIHTIHLPNEKGINCQFQARAIKSPTNIGHDFPNFPVFRANGACDDSIQFPTSSTSATAPKTGMLKVSPNPATHTTTIQIPDTNSHSKLVVANMLGVPVLSFSIPPYRTTFILDLTILSDGIYALTLENGAYLQAAAMGVFR